MYRGELKDYRKANLNFLETTSKELDERNREVGRIAVTAQLTSVYKRWELERKLEEAILNVNNSAGYALMFFDFETMKYSGFGSKVVQGVALPDHAMIVTAKHTSGSRNFIVDVYDEDGHCENIVNEIGFFSGEKVMKLQKNIRYFAIVQADGGWSIDLGRGDSQIRVSQVEG